jgi:hypothetical protein
MVVSWDVARLFLAIWLAAFVVQTTELLAFVAPDDCTASAEESSTGESSADPCPDACLRCVCCARVPAFFPQVALAGPDQPTARPSAFSPLDPTTTPSPHRIYHVPKHS